MEISNFSKILTIQETTFLGDLNEYQHEKLTLALNSLKISTQSTQVYRGVSKEHLVRKLISKSTESVSAEKILSLLFYFGDKAKHYYKVEDAAAAGLRYLKCVEDVSLDSNKVLFDEIADSLHKFEAVKKFKTAAPDFFSFFQNSSNVNKFSAVLLELGQLGRDYYLYLLHTIGSDNFSSHSLSVSTSTQFDVASAAGDFVIHYVIPSPFEMYAIDPISASVKKIEVALYEKGLPIYTKIVAYPTEYEVCIRSALFAHSILGVTIRSENSFIVNPHIFSEFNTTCSIITGLLIDQSSFNCFLPETAYHRGVGLTLDGNYHTINKKQES